MDFLGIEGQNFGPILENKVHQKSNLLQCVNNKSFSSFKTILNEKEKRKFSTIFDFVKPPLKWEFGYFWPLIPKKSKGLEFFYGPFCGCLAIPIHP